jgi:HNH endonuclease
MRKHIYPEVRMCIYCYSDGEGLGLRTEHIIPGGLGGRLELPCASCRPCEQETSALEGRVLNGIYGYSRAHLGVRREQHSKK